MGESKIEEMEVDVKELSFFERVSAVQMELKAPKGQLNSYGHYNYRSCEDILEAVKPLCNKYRLLLNITDKPVFVEGRYYIEATAFLFDFDSDKFIKSCAYAREDESKKGMDGSQITGCASSYARKYALNGLFNVDDTKDADTDEYKKNTDHRAPAIPQKFYCDACGCEIYSVKRRDGSMWPVADMATYSKRHYGNQLCAACMKAADKAVKEQKKGEQNDAPAK